MSALWRKLGNAKILSMQAPKSRLASWFEFASLMLALLLAPVAAKAQISEHVVLPFSKKCLPSHIYFSMMQ
jgi:hypothetical protein